MQLSTHQIEAGSKRSGRSLGEPKLLNLYKIKINMPVNAGTYYVVADGFDEAAGIAMTTDQIGGGHNGGIDQIEVVGSFGGDGENLLLSDKAANFFTAP